MANIITNAVPNDMPGDRVLALFSALLVQLVGLGVLFFWVMGLILLFSGNGGQINDIGLNGFPLMVYYAYPVLLGIFSLVGWLAFYRKLDIVALGALSVAPGVLLLLYLGLVMAQNYR